MITSSIFKIIFTTCVGVASCRGVRALARRRRDSSPSETALGGLNFDFGRRIADLRRELDLLLLADQGFKNLLALHVVRALL